MRLNVTPVPYDVPDPASDSLPTPLMLTVTDVGLQPPESVYLTEKRIAVVEVPLPGEAVPFVSVSVCELPLQLAARAGPTVTSAAKQMTKTRLRYFTRARPSYCGGCRCRRP